MIIAAVVTVFVGVISTMGLASAMGVMLYTWMRRSLYTRPLTADEQWAETTQQSPEMLVETDRLEEQQV